MVHIGGGTPCDLAVMEVPYIFKVFGIRTIWVLEQVIDAADVA